MLVVLVSSCFLSLSFRQFLKVLAICRFWKITYTIITGKMEIVVVEQENITLALTFVSIIDRKVEIVNIF